MQEGDAEGCHRSRVTALSQVRTLILSPHQDDVALSLGGALLSEFFPRPILYLNLFSVSMHVVNYQGILDAAHVTSVRTLEDREFARELGLGREDLGLRDMRSGSRQFLALSSILTDMPRRSVTVPSRVRRSLEKTRSMTSVFLRSIARIGGAYPRLLTYIRSEVRENLGLSLVAPLGLGNHPDHIVAACLGRDLEGVTNQVLYYEDLPYATSYRLREIDRHVRFFNSKLHPRMIDTTQVMGRKLEIVSAYRSQSDEALMTAVTRHARRIARTGSAERIWVV